MHKPANSLPKQSPPDRDYGKQKNSPSKQSQLVDDRGREYTVFEY